MHSGILLVDGTVKFFGNNSRGQCDVPDLQGRKVTQIDCGLIHSAVLVEDSV